jgi:hypothetical protein
MSNETPPAGEGEVIEHVRVTKIHGDLSQQIVQMTVDKLRLTLLEHSQALVRSREWATPLGILIAIVLTLVTSKFRDALGMSADSWKAVFVIGAAGTVLWLFRAFFNWLKKPTLDQLLEKLKKPE